jgi:hypothetical protein
MRFAASSSSLASASASSNCISSWSMSRSLRSERAIERAPQLFDLQPQSRDQRVGSGAAGALSSWTPSFCQTSGSNGVCVTVASRL